MTSSEIFKKTLMIFLLSTTNWSHCFVPFAIWSNVDNLEYHLYLKFDVKLFQIVPPSSICRRRHTNRKKQNPEVHTNRELQYTCLYNLIKLRIFFFCRAKEEHRCWYFISNLRLLQKSYSVKHLLTSRLLLVDARQILNVRRHYTFTWLPKC